MCEHCEENAVIKDRVTELEAALADRPTWRQTPFWLRVHRVLKRIGGPMRNIEIVHEVQRLGMTYNDIDIAHVSALIRMSVTRRPDIFYPQKDTEGNTVWWLLDPDRVVEWD